MKRKYIFSIALLFIMTSGFCGTDDFLWGKQMGGTGHDFAYFVHSDHAGNTYVTGHFSDTADFDPGPGVYNLISSGYYDIFIAKFNPDGGLLWAKSIGGKMFEEGLSLTTDYAGDIFVTGYFNDTVDFDPGAGIYKLASDGPLDAIFVLRLDNNGSFVWARNINGWGNHNIGFSIDTDENSNVYFTGAYDGTADFDPGPGIYNLVSTGWRDIFVCKYNSAGMFLWAQSFGYGSPYGGDQGRIIHVDATNHVYVAGEYTGTVDFDAGPGVYNSTSSGNSDVFILKLSTSGSFIWMRDMGGSQFEMPYSMCLDPAGNVYSTGVFVGTGDFDPGPDTFNLTSSNGSAFISKLNADGNFLWAEKLGNGNIASQAIVTNNSGSIYIAGLFSDSVDFDPGGGVQYLVTDSVYYSFLLKLSDDGSFESVKSFGGGRSCCARSMSVCGSGIYITGEFTDTANLNTDNGYDECISKGDYDIYLVKLENNEMNENTVTSALSNIFTPNNDGQNDLFLIKGLKEGSSVKIYNLWGKELIEINSEKMISSGWDGRTASGEPCSDGVYYFLINNDREETRKGFVELLR